MKKEMYTVRYLPVAGEVRDGDITAVMDDEGQLVFCIFRKTPHGLQTSQRYESFLCTSTTGIKPGDAAAFFSVHGWRDAGVVRKGPAKDEEDRFTLNKVRNKGAFVQAGVYMKVLGPMAPATREYTHDGDEYSPDQVVQDEKGWWPLMELQNKS
jgi:hypothetical protein